MIDASAMDAGIDAGIDDFLLDSTSALGSDAVGGDAGVVDGACATSGSPRMAPFMMSSLPTAATALTNGAPPPNVSIDAAWMTTAVAASSSGVYSTSAPHSSASSAASPGALSQLIHHAAPLSSSSSSSNSDTHKVLNKDNENDGNHTNGI